VKGLNGMENIPKGGLKGLLYYKLGDLSKDGINVVTNISPKIKKDLFSKIDIELYKDIVKILGIYLDNAIEAVKNASNKEIFLEMHNTRNKFHIVLSNTYHQKPNLDVMGDVGYSTKGKGRGYGL